MGSGLPGEWSTDYAITKETYLHWFQLIQEAGANTLRVYSVQNPSFYKAFYEYNSQHEEPLYLLRKRNDGMLTACSELSLSDKLL